MSAPPSTEPPEWIISDGRTPYAEALAAMEAHVGAIRAGGARERIWLVEHDPTYTAGTSARPQDLHDARFPVFNAGRGGQWTYHGPGQRTGYVMLDLNQAHGSVPARDVRAYVHGLEEWLIRTLARFNIRAERRAGRVGLWVPDRAGGENKIAAIGVRVTRWVTWHGVALNVEPDLSHFGGIVPCGVAEHGVTSIAAQGVMATMDEADAALRGAWGEVFG
ncbi:lipoyl(octanoyl) transferase LipB [Roseomonas fluvialis]|uniref:Octanoyltransferase n=1 Tax=Roseomonas fluvialis TaxID=1750527 RepID=A0ABM7Y814_9PROT|nr:lipoyl(octanoyl) transferase LipB [Roseomonas fluvialis]BDG74141.1 octanoyltransferase [Roseomonas fluvialis]